jgi:GTP-binding protein
MLAGRKALARVSSVPGHTQLINFFTFNNAWRMVDLPGYGYVKLAPGTREKFADLITGYLTQRPVIRRVFVCIDSRHEPQRIDLDFLTWLTECRVPCALVFTKTDKLKPAAVARNAEAFQAALKELTGENPPVFTCSSETRAGRAELLHYIGSLL